MQSPGIPNAYDDGDRAAAYADLGFTGTYYLAFRDLPDLISSTRYATASPTPADPGRALG